MPLRARLCLLVLVAMVQAFAFGRAHAQAPANVAPLSAKNRVRIEEQLRTMTREQKVAQLLLIGFGGTDVGEFLRTWVGHKGVGGVALFARNLRTPSQVRALTLGMAQLAGDHVTPFIAIDQEGGPVLRIRHDFAVLPGNMVLGAAGQSSLAYAAGRATASDLLRLGFNMNFTPVLDVNSNPDNPVINVRSFGEKPSDVARLGRAFLLGQQSVGIASVAKHFPGHGDTSADSHFAMPRIDADLLHLQRVELPPFRAAIEAGVDAIMTAHISLPNISREADVPATLSHSILTGLLRQRMGYDGVIITDGLEMQGIAQRFGIGPSAVKAVLAGADMPMVLWSDEGCQQAYAALLRAVEHHEITAARLDASVRRILTAKARLGLLDGRFRETSFGVDDELKENRVHASLMQRIADDGVTLLKNEGGCLPVGEGISGWLVAAPEGPLLRRLRDEGGATPLVLPALPTRAQRQQIVAKLTEALRKHEGLIGAVANRYHVDMLRAALATRPATQAVVVSLASPYWLNEFPDATAWLSTYSTLPVAQRAAADVVLGERAPEGRLPVRVGPDMPVGHQAPFGVRP